ncbi:energy transducer TonB [Microvirga sp. STS02]|uniref:energy transducer TonB n=1 Tax=Hymenobacter negativus TaxID=2795026 RepID=UPI0018DCC371|nr:MULTISPECIES: energy transducer TonB [Bacteria]MBH8570437.1 energy transducer TonB [Hymenobacter negativus]MBR7210176.1 energy transducer TonB [Microvirga sp. STS02]
MDTRTLFNILGSKHSQRLWLLLVLALLITRPAAAQYYGQYAVDTTQIFNYVDQMPTLPGGGGNLALVKAVQQHLQLPVEVREGRTEGRVFVRVVVGVSGVARQAAVVQSLSPACDAAALAAVKRMPRLLPGRYQGQPVAVLLTVPVMFLSPRHVFASTEVSRPAQFPGGDAGLEQYLQKNKTTPAEVKQRDLKGRVVVRFVLKPDGRVGASEVINSLCPSCDDEALRLVRGFPRWQPALGYDDQPVAMYQVVNIWFSPPAPPSGQAAPVPENQVYSQVEQMPVLPGRSGSAGLQAALQELIEYPERAPSGEGQVSFVVEPDGRVTRPVMLKPINSAMDEAVLTAALHLPRFEPGRHNGQPVAVRLAVPVLIDIR